MNGFAWDHNAYYHRRLLRQLPTPCHHALDVGAGAGTFAAKLAEHATWVHALDRCPAIITAAEYATPDNVCCTLSDARHGIASSAKYDAIFSISALHHLSLPDTLPRLATALRPGGVLAAVSVPRRDLPRVELSAAIGNRVLGAVFAGARVLGHGTWYAREPTAAIMPTRAGTLTTRQVRAQAARALPGVRVRRMLFWRYFLLWHKPA